MQKQGSPLSPQKRGEGGSQGELLGGLVLPTVPENLSPGLKGRGTGLSGHDLTLVGSLLRAGMAPALQAGQDLACRPWARSLVAAGHGDVVLEACAG